MPSPAGPIRSAHPVSGIERVLLFSAAEREAAPAVIARLCLRIRAVARAHRLAPHDADDVVQSTWLRLLEHCDRIREPGALVAWLQTTARRESLRILRENARMRPTEDAALEVCDPRPDAQSELEAAERAAALEVSIDALSARQAALMRALLHDPEPCYAALSRSLGMPVGAIGPTRGRAFDRLRSDGRLCAVAAPHHV
jgi:RNA polymerase sigma factor (sigma-70 family)